jgi:flagellar assembly protein FliH
MRIHLSGKDWEWYKLLPPEDKPPYPVIVDESLKPGDTTLECAEGIFDARIHSQLEKIGQYLFEELDHGGLDGFNQKD